MGGNALRISARTRQSLHVRQRHPPSPPPPAPPHVLPPLGPLRAPPAADRPLLAEPLHRNVERHGQGKRGPARQSRLGSSSRPLSYPIISCVQHLPELAQV